MTPCPGRRWRTVGGPPAPPHSLGRRATGHAGPVSKHWVHRWADQLRSTVHALEPDDTQPLPRLSPEPPPTDPVLVELLRGLAKALANSAESADRTTERLQEVAAAYDADVSALVMPTGVLFRVGSTDVDLVTVSPRPLRLDQVADVDALITVLTRAGMSPAEGLRRLSDILASPPRFHAATTFGGSLLLSLGFGLVLNPDVRALPWYLALGGLVGVLRMVANRWATLSVALPVFAAFVVAALTALVVVPMTGDDALRLLAPPLVAFLPGATLTIATIELANNQIVSGASRLVWGLSQLLLLVFGVLAGLSVASYEPAGPGVSQLGAWAPWVGVLVVGVGYMLFSSAPPGSLIFLLVALTAAYAAQAVGAVILTAQFSGFAGGLVIAPLTQLLAWFPRAPSSTVMLLPAFWLLVPGALGLRNFSQAAVGVGADNLLTTGLSIIAVALGVLVGSSLTRDALAVTRTFRSHP